MRPQPLIAVTDVEASSRWHQRLPGCASNHGGSAYEQLVSDGQLILQLHSFEVEQHHVPIGDRDAALWKRVLLWFEADDFEAVVQRSAEMNAEMIMPRPRNQRRIIGSAGCGTRTAISSLLPVPTERPTEPSGRMNTREHR
jgi:hypothetical protein